MPGWEYPKAYVEDVADMGLKGREENAGNVGLDQVVKGWKWPHEQSVCKESGRSKVSLICVNKSEFLPVHL